MESGVEEVENLIVGSGPSAAGALQALVDRGRPCTVLDIGVKLEPSRRAAADALAALPLGSWSAEEMGLAFGGMTPTLRGVAVKTSFGSRYPYYDALAPHALLDASGSALGVSQAMGGFTSVWGAAALPFLREDMTGWPEEVDLSPFYAPIQRVMPVTGGADGLEGAPEAFGPTVAPVPCSPEVRAFHEDLDRARDRLRRRGISHARGRVAVGRPVLDRDRNSCNACGFCLNGCPYGLIFNTADLVAAHAASGSALYLGGLEVDRLSPGGDGVLVHALCRATGETRRFFARRVFLGGGVVGTARVVAASLGLDRLELAVKDTCHFLVPFLRGRGAREYRQGGLRLSQGFLQFAPGTLSARRVNLQIYGYNGLFEALVDRLLRPVVGGLRLPRELLLSRLLLFQGYLHSDESPVVTLTVERVAERRYRATTRTEGHPLSRRIVGRVVRALLRESLALGGVPLLPLVKVESPGRSFHFGGSFPMRSRPQEPFETDRWGRLAKLPRVHLVDPSVFPSIPSTTMVLATMANAYRIACGAPE
jgi:choline dehydrogenase-like flavoprotein